MAQLKTGTTIGGRNIVQELDAHLADYEYQTPTVVGTQIRLAKQSNTNILKFKLANDLSGGAITISLDGGSTSKPLVDIEGNAVTEFSKGFVEVIESADFFTYAPKGGGNNIKSIQRGRLELTSTSQNINISAVDTSKAVIYVNYQSGISNGTAAVRGKIVDSTTINLSKFGTDKAYVSWVVVEFDNVKSLQKGDYTLSTGIATIPISTVDLNKSLLVCSWQSDNSDNASYSVLMEYGFQDASNIYLNIATDALKNRYVHWQVIEFK